MNIMDMLDEEKSIAQKKYDSMKKNILGIRETKGFEEILQYFERTIDWIEWVLLKDLDDRELRLAQAEYKAAHKFLSFLENISKS